jgi:dephospho-CoA kinase
MDQKTVRAIMATQMSRQERLARADDVILNDADLSQLERQVDVMHRKYLVLSRC